MNCLNDRCRTKLDANWNYCPMCGGAILSKGNTENLKIEEQTQIMGALLEEFGVDATITAVTVEPDALCYEILPGPGTRVERIKSLKDDVALQMHAHHIEITVPIPRQGVCGIKVFY